MEVFGRAGKVITIPKYFYDGDGNKICKVLYATQDKGEVNFFTEIIEPEIAPDENTHVDTKVYVRDNKQEEWHPAYFKGINRQFYQVWKNGAISFSIKGEIHKTSSWKYCKLA